MKTIDLEKEQNASSLIFPDGQPHVNVHGITAGDEVKVLHRIRSPLQLMQLMQISNALDRLGAKKKDLVIPYLMAARSDRVMKPGDSVDLRVVADCVNMCGFERVNLFDVHSDVALELIAHSKNHNNSLLVKEYKLPNAVLICPDAGALKKIDKLVEWAPNITDVVFCNKTRDMSNGRISLQVLDPNKCEGRNCVIIDDLCDGGATFNAIGEQINASHLTLIVSHGIFSKGFRALEGHFHSIITSNSYAPGYESNIVNLVKIFP
jgi:ribose-phosphate pyrophosphokinase